MMVEKLLKLPGFLYDIGGRYYYLGKWICKECTDTEATDCVTMYHMCRNGHEEPDTNLYFQKIHSAILPWIFLITLPRLKRIWQLWQRP